MIVLEVAAATLVALFMRMLLVHSPNPIRFYLLLVWAGITLVPAFISFLVILPVVVTVGRQDLASYTFVQVWWYLVSAVWGVRLQVEGRDHLRGRGGPPGQTGNDLPCVAVPNHQSELDILLGSQVMCRPITLVVLASDATSYCSSAHLVSLDAPRGGLEVYQYSASS
jgi:hypothetical protein